MGAILIAEFDLDGAPELINRIGHKSWPIKMREARKWRVKVSDQCRLLKIANLNLTKAKLTFTRHSVKEPDFDNLAISFKNAQDGLVDALVIIDDKPSVIGTPTYLWLFRRRRMGCKITIRIEKPE